MLSLAVAALLFAAAVRAADPVDVELFVMSKCPDAVLCEQEIPYDDLKLISNITLQYIASYKQGEFKCLHEEPECEGNVQQLCARSVAEKMEKLDLWWQFVNCQGRNRTEIPDNGLACAVEVGLDLAAWEACLTDGTGTELFRISAEYTTALNVRACCSVYMNHELRCVHDTEWKQCPDGYEKEDFLRTACEAYTGSDVPDYCKNL